MSCMESETRLALMGIRNTETHYVARTECRSEEIASHIESLRSEATDGFAYVAVAALFLAVSIAATLGV